MKRRRREIVYGAMLVVLTHTERPICISSVLGGSGGCRPSNAFDSQVTSKLSRITSSSTVAVALRLRLQSFAYSRRNASGGTRCDLIATNTGTRQNQRVRARHRGESSLVMPGRPANDDSEAEQSRAERKAEREPESAEGTLLSYTTSQSSGKGPSAMWRRKPLIEMLAKYYSRSRSSALTLSKPKITKL